METVRVAAVGDLHCSHESRGAVLCLLEEASAAADVLLLCGDLLQTGSLAEARILAELCSTSLSIPALAVLGNHDCDGGKERAICALLREAGIDVLDGEGRTLFGIGFAGIKGFGGGFGPHALEPFGEEPIRRFVEAAIAEARKLDDALASLVVGPRIAFMHYAPTPSTLEGEPPALHPFLGSSRLAEPLARHGVLVALHGHAHQGVPEGRTESGVPVLNVARPVLEGSSWPRGFRIVEVRPEEHTRPRPDATPATGVVGERTAGYRRALAALSHAGVDFVVGGSHALEVLTGIDRHPRDLDLFVLPADRYLALDALGDAGFDVELRDPHWLGRAERDGERIDLIHGTPNGVAQVEPDWFDHAIDGVVVGVPTQVLAAEEMIWSKAFVMERHRFDGADVAHLIRARGAGLHWERLERRFGDHWRLLLSHLVLFGFVYPGDRDRIPRGLLDRLIQRLSAEGPDRRAEAALCQGGLLSPTQYQPDFECFGYGDVRLPPHGGLTAAAVALQRRRSRKAG